MANELNPVVLYLTRYQERLKVDRLALLEAQVVDKDEEAAHEVLSIQGEIRDIERIIARITS